MKNLIEFINENRTQSAAIINEALKSSILTDIDKSLKENVKLYKEIYKGYEIMKEIVNAYIDETGNHRIYDNEEVVKDLTEKIINKLNDTQKQYIDVEKVIGIQWGRIHDSTIDLTLRRIKGMEKVTTLKQIFDGFGYGQLKWSEIEDSDLICLTPDKFSKVKNLSEDTAAFWVGENNQLRYTSEGNYVHYYIYSNRNDPGLYGRTPKLIDLKKDPLNKFVFVVVNKDLSSSALRHERLELKSGVISQKDFEDIAKRNRNRYQQILKLRETEDVNDKLSIDYETTVSKIENVLKDKDLLKKDRYEASNILDCFNKLTSFFVAFQKAQISLSSGYDFYFRDAESAKIEFYKILPLFNIAYNKLTIK